MAAASVGAGVGVDVAVGSAASPAGETPAERANTPPAVATSRTTARSAPFEVMWAGRNDGGLAKVVSLVSNECLTDCRLACSSGPVCPEFVTPQGRSASKGIERSDDGPKRTSYSEQVPTAPSGCGTRDSRR